MLTSTSRVLVTNDDGIGSIGLIALARALEARGANVVVAAPAVNMSGAGAAMGPIGPTVAIERTTIEGIHGPCFAVHAPPAMIVIAAMNGAFGDKPTCVASGVNAGVNLGRAILHSGTVGAAMTGQNLGCPSVAVSLQGDSGWDVAAAAGVHMLERIADRERPMIVNVNVPAGATASTPMTATSLARFGSVTASITGDELQFQLVIDAASLNEEGTDGAAVNAGKISVTFLSPIGGVAESDVDVTLRTVPVTETSVST